MINDIVAWSIFTSALTTLDALSVLKVGACYVLVAIAFLNSLSLLMALRPSHEFPQTPGDGAAKACLSQFFKASAISPPPGNTLTISDIISGTRLTTEALVSSLTINLSIPCLTKSAAFYTRSVLNSDHPILYQSDIPSVKSYNLTVQESSMALDTDDKVLYLNSTAPSYTIGNPSICHIT